jgi:hypothetical protein
MQLAVSPERAPLDAPVTIRLTGLTAGDRVTVRTQMMGFGTSVWNADATFVADGVIDVHRDAPISGSYEGIDSVGLFWSMREHASAAALVAPADQMSVRITAEVDGSIAARLKPIFSQPIAMPRREAGNRSPAAAITAAGPKPPKMPASSRSPTKTP